MTSLHGTDAVARDNEGYLLDPSDWHEELAAELADECGIELGQQHWQVLRFIRGWYEERQSVPQAREALRVLAADAAAAGVSTRRHMQSLFPYGYGQQACKIAGMRKPLKLMLDV